MPKFKIIEKVYEHRYIYADTAQEALDQWLNDGQGSHEYVSVEERTVEDENGKECKVIEP